MTKSILIVDDSRFARAVLKKVLCEINEFEIEEAVDGEDALQHLRQKQYDLVFLDLTMPVMDGYQVLDVMQKEGIQSYVAVLSADIQPEAKTRVLQLGAKVFIQKKSTPNEISSEIGHLFKKMDFMNSLDDEHMEILQEIMNMSMGEAGAALANFLNRFVKLSVPNLSLVNKDTLILNIQESMGECTEVAAARQAFYNKLNGEVINLFNHEGYQEIKKLLGSDELSYEMSDQELILDISNILNGACLNRFAQHLEGEEEISYQQPSIISQRESLANLFQNQTISYEQALLLTITFTLEDSTFNAHSIILFPDESIYSIKKMLENWLEVF